MKKIVYVFAYLLIISFQINAQWVKQNSPTANNLNDVCFVTKDIGWIVGENGTILKTTNGGDDWIVQLANLTQVFYAVSFADTNNGIAVGDAKNPNNRYERNIYKTTDGGLNWVTQEVPIVFGIYPEMYDVKMIDKNTAIACGSEHIILITTNGGDNWQITNYREYGGPLKDLHFIDSNNGWAVGGDIGNQKFYKTTDGGLTWGDQKYEPPVGSYLGISNVFFVDINNGWVNCDGHLDKTTNSGETWTYLKNAPYILYNETGGIFFTDRMNGYVVKEKNIFKTVDSGISWKQQYSGNLNLSGLYFIDNNVGTVVGNSGTILRTTNGGITFVPPILLSPANKSINQPLSLQLNWQPVYAATSYSIQVAEDSTFKNPIIYDSLLTNTFYNLTKLKYYTNYYWRVEASYQFGKSGWSNVWSFKTIIEKPEIPLLNYPIDNAIQQPLTLTVKWNSSLRSEYYHLQVSLDSLFGSIIYQDSLITDTVKTTTNLVHNTKYYWRVKAKNVGGVSNYTEKRNFVTLIIPPTIVNLKPANKKITLNWTQTQSTNLNGFKIFRDITDNPITLIDSVTGETNTYTDTGLVNKSTYYYRIKSISKYGFESDFSNQLSATPINLPPIAVKLNDVFLPNEGRELLKDLSFSSAGSTDADGTIDSVNWFVDEQLISTDTDLYYSCPQGTHRVSLVVIDNDQGTDTSNATVTRTMFRKFVNGQVVAGLSLIGSNILYAIVNGDAIYKMDTDGNIAYTLQVGGSLLAASSIANDSSLYIGSTDNNIYAFSRYGTSIWNKPLGGSVVATPTIDLKRDRIYVGVSNKNFQFINRKNGVVLGNYFADAPIVTSAVITSKNKLFFSTIKGTMYGFELNGIAFPNVVPTWIIAATDTISSSPAVDKEGFLYVGTSNGKLKKISIQEGQQGDVVWETKLGGQITASPVIDYSGNIYIGSSNNKFFSIDKIDGNINWSRDLAGAVKTTAAISDLVARIYFGTENGYIYCLDTLGTTLWEYKDSSSICSSLLYTNGTLYLGTLDGRLVAINDLQKTIPKTDIFFENIWATYQGNNQRTGEQIIPITSAEAEYAEIPQEYNISNNYPNPFNPSTVIRYSVPFESRIKIEIYNIIGELVSEPVNLEQAPGYYDVTFDATGLASGIYIYRIVAQSTDNKNIFSQVKKMILLK